MKLTSPRRIILANVFGLIDLACGNVPASARAWSARRCLGKVIIPTSPRGRRLWAARRRALNSGVR